MSRARCVKSHGPKQARTVMSLHTLGVQVTMVPSRRLQIQGYTSKKSGFNLFPRFLEDLVPNRFSFGFLFLEAAGQNERPGKIQTKNGNERTRTAFRLTSL